MTTIVTSAEVDSGSATQAWVPTERLAPHPDNPRRTIGDLTELTRSVKAHGVLMPLLVLPADDHGVHLIVAGHRRHAAAVGAELASVPVIVRAMTEVEVVEAMIIENEHRGDLTISEQVHAIERLMNLEDGLTPAKLNRRIGKSKAWVRSRMALAVVPQGWRDRIDTGDLTVAAAEAATTIADLGPEHLEVVLDRLADTGSWQDPARVVEAYRRDLDRQAAYEVAIEKARKRAGPVFTTDDPPPDSAKPVRDLFDRKDLIDAHAKLGCHATVVRRVSWGDGAELVTVCTSPRDHRPRRNEDGDDSTSEALVSDRGRTTASDDGPAKRKGRLARAAHLADAFGRSRGGPAKADLTVLALRALVHEAGQEPIKYATAILGLDPGDHPRDSLMAEADASAAGLVRVAAALACGIAESHMYWSSSSPRCTEYLALLCDTGWTPDDWTAQHMTDATGGESAVGND